MQTPRSRELAAWHGQVAAAQWTRGRHRTPHQRLWHKTHARCVAPYALSHAGTATKGFDPGRKSAGFRGARLGGDRRQSGAPEDAYNPSLQERQWAERYASLPGSPGLGTATDASRQRGEGVTDRAMSEEGAPQDTTPAAQKEPSVVRVHADRHVRQPRETGDLRPGKQHQRVRVQWIRNQQDRAETGRQAVPQARRAARRGWWPHRYAYTLAGPPRYGPEGLDRGRRREPLKLQHNRHRKREI